MSQPPPLEPDSEEEEEKVFVIPPLSNFLPPPRRLQPPPPPSLPWKISRSISRPAPLAPVTPEQINRNIALLIESDQKESKYDDDEDIIGPLSPLQEPLPSSPSFRLSQPTPTPELTPVLERIASGLIDLTQADTHVETDSKEDELMLAQLEVSFRTYVKEGLSLYQRNIFLESLRPIYRLFVTEGPNKRRRLD